MSLKNTFKMNAVLTAMAVFFGIASYGRADYETQVQTQDVSASEEVAAVSESAMENVLEVVHDYSLDLEDEKDKKKKQRQYAQKQQAHHSFLTRQPY